MSVNFTRSCSVAALLAFSSQAAWADVTPNDVWTDWKAYLASSGYEVTATEVQSGDTLKVTDISMVMDFPGEDGTITIALPSLDLVDNGDGSVNTTFPAEFPVTFDGAVDDEPVQGEILVSTDGAPAIVTGDNDDMTYSYDSSKLSISLNTLTVEGETVPADVFKATLALTNMRSVTKVKTGDARAYDQTYDADSLSYEFSFKDPEGPDNGTFKGALTGLKFAGTSVLPGAFETGNLLDMLKKGFAFDGGFTFASGHNTMIVEGSDSFELQSSSQGGDFKVSMNEDALIYDLSQTQGEMSIVSDEMPFPIAFSAAEIGLKFLMPPTATEDDRDMGLGITLRDFNVPEALWAVADPTGTLPHDPASIIVDLSGKGRWLVDLFDPKLAEANGFDVDEPAVFNSVDIKQLLVRAAGAELTGTGSFELDNDDLETYEGMPAPIGVANLSLVGANGLLDNLIKMGLMSESDASGVRLMMGLLAVPGEGEDSLKSEIEFGAGGKILANGQRIK